MLQELRARIASLFEPDTEQTVDRTATALDEMMSDFAAEQGQETLEAHLEDSNNIGDLITTLEANSSLSAEDYGFHNVSENDT